MEIRLENLGKTFPPGVQALRDVSLTVGPGEWLALVGPSGCGKSTLLRIVAGLEEPTTGAVLLGNQDVTRVPAWRRGVALLFQKPALLPGRSVRDNLAWGWTLARREPWHSVTRLFGGGRLTAEQRDLLLRVARLLHLEAELDRPAGQLSGGQQQRVALGRTLLRRPAVALLDEPLGHLDAPLREALRRDIRLLYEALPATIVHVTHDPAEALALAGRIAVLHRGALQQVDAPRIMVERPANRFVAEWFAPSQGGMNFVDGRVRDEAGRRWFDGPLGRWPLPDAWHTDVAAHPEVTLGIPCRAVRAGESAAAAGVTLTMPVVREEFDPAGSWVTCQDERGRMTGRAAPGGRLSKGQMAMLRFVTDRAFCFDRVAGTTLFAPTG